MEVAGSPSAFYHIIFFRQYIQFFFQIWAYPVYMVNDSLFLKQIQHFTDCRPGQWIAAICRAMIAAY